MKWNMTKWLSDVTKDGKAFMPILYYPCVGLTEHKVGETVASGGASAMVAVMKAAIERFPAMAFAQTGLDVTVDTEAFGCRVEFSEGAAPRTVSSLVTTQEEANALAVPTIHAGRQDDAAAAVKLAKETITDRPVFGNILGPFTLAAGVIPFNEAMFAVMKKGELMHTVCEKCTEYLINRALALKEAGADGIILDEASGGVIPPKKCAEFSSAYIKKIVDAVQDDSFIVMLHNCGNITRMQDSIYATGCRIYSFGNMIDLAGVMEKLPDNAYVTGNLNPMFLKTETKGTIIEETEKLLEKMAGHPRFILAPGCDCPPDIKLENIDGMIEALATH